MIKAFNGLKWAEVLPRIVVDFLLVHLSMIAALAFAVTYAMSSGTLNPDPVGYAYRYYSFFAVALSPCFPIMFLLCGFYSRARTFRTGYKILVILRGVGISLLVFLALNFLLFRSDLVARTAGLPFSCFLAASILLARYLKSTVFDPNPSEQVVTEKSGPDGTVLIVGGAGYIGSILARQLLEAGRHVRILDNLTYGVAGIRDLFSNRKFELMVGDCRNIQDMVAAMKEVDSVVHLAAIVGDPACEKNRQSALEINYAATRMLIEIAKGNGVERVVFASSCSVYGATDCLSDEESPVSPISLYAQTKVDSEQALLQSATSSFHPTALRLATVFGHSWRPRFDLVVNLLTAKAKQEGTITIFNGEQWRPFIHVTDVARAFVEVLSAPVSAVSGEIFNVGDSRNNFTLTQVAEKVKTEFPDTDVVHQDNADRRNYRVSFDKIYNRLGYRCATSLETGIREIRAAIEAGGIISYKDAAYSNFSYLNETGTPGHRSEIDVGVMAAFAAPLPQQAPFVSAASA